METVTSTRSFTSVALKMNLLLGVLHSIGGRVQWCRCDTLHNSCNSRSGVGPLGPVDASWSSTWESRHRDCRTKDNNSDEHFHHALYPMESCFKLSWACDESTHVGRECVHADRFRLPNMGAEGLELDQPHVWLRET